MKKITITAQILSGNIGDGWKDNHETAVALAEFTRDVWTRELSGYAIYNEIEIDISVERASGCTRGRQIHCDDYDTTVAVEEIISSENEIWEKFCEPENSSEYYSED